VSPTCTLTLAGSAPSDEALLSRIAAGDDGALGQLYDRYGRLAFGLALRVIRDRALAEDAVQEAFVSVWRSAARFEPNRGTARVWVLSLVHRRAVDIVRREERRHSKRSFYAAAAAVESAEEATWFVAERRRVQDALDRLPESLGQLLQLAYYGGLTQSEIAKRLDIPLGTVKSRTSTALARLRRLLTEEVAQDSASTERRPEAVECAAVGA